MKPSYKEWEKTEKAMAALKEAGRDFPPQVIIDIPPKEELDFFKPLEFLYKYEQPRSNRMIELPHNVFRDFGVGERMHQHIITEVGTHKTPEGLVVFSEYSKIFLKDVQKLLELKPIKVVVLNWPSQSTKEILLTDVRSLKIYFLLEGADIKFRNDRKIFKPDKMGKPRKVMMVINDVNLLIGTKDVIRVIQDLEKYVDAVIGAGDDTGRILKIYAKAVGRGGKY